MADNPIGDLTEQDYLDWKHHPVTRLFRRYLGDFRDALRRDHTLRWEGGASPSDAFEIEARGRVLTLGELVDLEFRHIADFYPSKQDQTADESETGED